MAIIEEFDTVLIIRINMQGTTIFRNPADGRWLVSCINENASEEAECKYTLFACSEADLQLVHKGSEEGDSFETIYDLSPSQYEIIKGFRSLSDERKKEFMEMIYENMADISIKLDQLS